MPRIAVAAVCLAVCLGLASPAHADTAFEVDPVHSMVVFQIRHLGVSNFYGRFNKVEGTFRFDEAKPESSELAIEIPVTSIFTADKKRDDHLEGPDFFSAKQFPTIRFVSTTVARVKGDRYRVAGKLTLRGVTKPVVIELEKIGEGPDPWGGYRIGFEARFELDRFDYGMKYSDKALGRKVAVIVSIEGVRK